MRSILLDLLHEENSIFQTELAPLKNWELYPVFEYYLTNLRKEYLYHSHIHGLAHIERVLLFGAILAMETGCNEADTRLLLTACSYHDIGRMDDSVDDDHGRRSSEMLPSFLPLSGESMAIVQASIYAHSVSDARMDDVLSQFFIPDRNRGLQIAKLLKDADALDRIRVALLDPNYLRFQCSHHYIDFSTRLFRYYCEKQVLKEYRDAYI